MAIRLTVNGREHEVDVDPDTPLLWVLRDELKLTGTKFGCGIAQCGYCQSGQVMSAVALLSENPSPGEQDIARGMAGNICRCAAYVRIRAAVRDAAKTLEG